MNAPPPGATIMNEPNHDPHQPTDGAPPLPVFEIMWQCLKVLASLRITVVLLSLGIILVFFGTLAQIDEGIWTVMDKYFRSWYVWVPTQLIAEFGKVFFDFSKTTKWEGKFPLPAGWLIGWAMLINLLAAHTVRFKLTWKRSGVLIIHSGIVFLMFGEFFTGLHAVESTMVLQNGETVSFIDDSRRFELAIRTRKDDKNDQVFVIPGSVLMSEKGKVISRDNLPVDVEVVDCMKNTDIVKRHRSEGEEGLIQFDGTYFKLIPAGEEPGVKAEREDAAAAKIRIRKKGSGEVIGEFFLSLWQYRNYNRRLFFAQMRGFEVDGKTYQVELRSKRVDKPYSIHLQKFEHSTYAGTSIAKDFASTIKLDDPQNNEQRQVRVWMNNPLRYEGETFYQAGYIPDESGTVLQVVNNPVWQWPYWSCSIITIGLLIHFGIHLNTFLRRRAKA